MAAESTLLTTNREDLVKNIRFVEPFLDKLLQTNQLTGEECEVVRSGRTPQDRARALIDLVGTKGQEAFGHFRYALKETNPELADILHRCTDHNEKIRLHCDDCVQLLCRMCNKEGHKGHRVSSIVADADVIRRDVTAFMRENRKLLKQFNISNEEEGRQKLLFDIEMRKNKLKAMFSEKIESEFEWCSTKLGARKSAFSPVTSISSIASTESESSGSEGKIEPVWSGKDKKRRRAHPYLGADQKDRNDHTAISDPPYPNPSNPASPVVSDPPSSNSTNPPSLVISDLSSTNVNVSTPLPPNSSDIPSVVSSHPQHNTARRHGSRPHDLEELIRLAEIRRRHRRRRSKECVIS
ncbi:uncharacterized protein LOC144881085 [Branchiostoma floridae x Branchiostoma japonicum]